MAACIYTGIATDTGCFKYANTTSYTLRMAADMMDLGADSETINRNMFDIKSRARIELERLALDNMRFYLNDRCAIMCIMADMIEKSGAGEADMEGLAPLPRQIEGVHVGVTLREKSDGRLQGQRTYRKPRRRFVDMRLLGGGGHMKAAGCMVAGGRSHAVETILGAVKAVIGE